MKVYLLHTGTYDERLLRGVYATRELAERALLDLVYAGDRVEGVDLAEEEVVES